MKIVKLFPNKYSKFHFGLLNLEINDYIFHSDSLFGAIVSNYVRLFGSDDLDDFVRSFPLISSLFYGVKNDRKEVYFIPSPKDRYIPKELLDEDRKLIKKIKFISFGYYKELVSDNLNAENVIVNDNKDLLYLKDEELNKDIKLFNHHVEEKVSINRKTGTTIERHLYTVSSIILNENVFFYFLIDENQMSERLKESIKAIESFGIGGERTTGYGSIEKVSISEFNHEFNHNVSEKYMTLSLLHPDSEEIEIVKNGSYTLIEKKGWVLLYEKNRTKNGLPKQPMFYITEGSVFDKKLTGTIKEEYKDGNKIYRYGKTMMVPFNPIKGEQK